MCVRSSVVGHCDPNNMDKTSTCSTPVFLRFRTSSSGSVNRGSDRLTWRGTGSLCTESMRTPGDPGVQSLRWTREEDRPKELPRNTRMDRHPTPGLLRPNRVIFARTGRTEDSSSRPGPGPVPTDWQGDSRLSHRRAVSFWTRNEKGWLGRRTPTPKPTHGDPGTFQ